MYPTSLERHWLSLHLFFGGQIYSELADGIVLNSVQPLVMEVCPFVEEWFFIRYMEAGSHIRLRLLVRPAVNCDHVREQIEDWSRRTWSQINVIDSVREPFAMRRDRAGRLAAWIPYVPEVQRYGGPRAMSSAERQFAASSALAVAELGRGAGASRESRLAAAMVVTLVAAFGFLDDLDDARVLLEEYTDGCLRSQGQTIDAASLRTAFAVAYQEQAARLNELVSCVRSTWLSRSVLTPALDAFCRSVAQAKRELSVLRQSGEPGDPPLSRETFLRIVRSHIHMTNNRLGISPVDEAYVSFLIAKTLSANC